MSQFIITVDTETYAVGGALPPFEANLYADLPQGSFGVGRIMDICDRHGVKATFFVDIYMHYAYGRKRVGELCRRIQDRGHDVQLHAHTSWLPGSDSDNLRTFPLARQVEIVCEGKEFVGNCTGRAPVAFRAGAYAANLDTISALRKNGIPVDSSYFGFHRNCQLSEQLGNRYANKLFMIDETVEVPVTVYWLFNNRFRRKLSKIDINASSLGEMQDAIPQLMARNLKCIVLFLHSFSFVRWKRDSSGVVPNPRAVNRFERLMESLVEHGGNQQFCTMEQAAKSFSAQDALEEDFIPAINPIRVFSRAVQRIIE